MPDIVLHNMPHETLAIIKEMAEEHDRSLEDELRGIIMRAAAQRPLSKAESVRVIHEWQEYWKKQGKVFSEPLVLVSIGPCGNMTRL